MDFDSKNAFEDLNLSTDEVERLANAFKKEEFRKLFKDYAEEIADPENRRRYEDEIKQMENERGMDIEFVNPVPGYVVKTTYNGEMKAFINICKNEHIEKPSSQRQVGPDGKAGLSWSIPHSFAPARDDVDKFGNKCKVFDFVVHPDTYRMAETNDRFKKMIHNTAFDGIERQFDTKLDRKNMKFPKMTFKGTPKATVVRKKSTEPVEKKDSNDINDVMNSFPYPYDNKTSEEKAKLNAQATKKKVTKPAMKVNDKKMSEEKVEDEFATPKYVIKHRSEVDFQDYRNAPDSSPSLMPKELVVEVDLPLLKSAAPVDLDIFERRLILKSTEPAKYKLDVVLPYPVDENLGSAKFDKGKRKLCITLPVVRSKVQADVPSVNGHSEHLDQVQANGETPHMSGLMNDGAIPQSRPLIEVLPDDQRTDIVTPAVCEPVVGDLKDPDVITQQRDSRETMHTLPNYDFHQDDETVSFILHTGHVDRASVKLTYPSVNALQVEMSSTGSGGFSIHYRLHIRFPAECHLETGNCRADVDLHNVVLILVKTDSSVGLWDQFEAGLSEDTLQEKLFLTRSNLSKRVCDLATEDGGHMADGELSPELEVTEMDNEKLVVNFKDEPRSRRKKRMSESADDIEIVYNHEAPQLRGIIKNRSISESSDDIYACARQSSSTSDDICACARQNSTTSFNGSESSPIESDDYDNDISEGGTMRKKTVSFSEHIDQTTYKTNQSVSSMKATLRNKRKKQRKTERRHTEKQERRRRKSSGSEGASSDEMPLAVSPSTSNTEKDIQVTLSIPDSPAYDVEGDDEASPTIDKSEKLKVKTKTRADKKDSDCEQGENAEVTCGLDERTGELPQMSSTVIASSDAHDSVPLSDSNKSSDILDVRTNNDDPKKVNSQETAQLDSDDGEEPQQNGPIKSSLIQELDPQEQHNREGVTDDSKNSQSKADTMLSWRNGPQSSEHSTTCAVDFSNSVVFDLDSD